MVFITGDTHANIDISKLNSKNFSRQKTLTKNDYLIVCGDFGLVWDGSPREIYWQDWLASKNFTTLFVDGNHENFDILRCMPLHEMFGGYVREIVPGIYHLERGQVLEIDGKKIFVMGGARSVDKEYRIEHISWWKEEMPSKEEMEYALASLDTVDWEVDAVVTHCAPKLIQRKIASWYENDQMTSFLDRICSDLKFKKWYFGHYHIDRQIDDKFFALFNNVVPMF